MDGILVDTLRKTYHKGKTLAVNDVSFSVGKGELFGLIGPDGAGKSSIFRMLTTLLLPDSGIARVNGLDIVKDYRAIRKCVGYMPGKFSLYQDLTVAENLEFFATIFNTTVGENYALIEDIYIQIEPFRDRRAGKLSGGMKQKLALCCALIHRPVVLFLDEPTTGVDTVSRKEFWDMLKRLKQQGITILVSTPYMDEANLCERIALMQDGKILSVDTPDNIMSAYGKPLYAVRALQMSRLLLDLKGNSILESCYAFGEYHHITFRDSRDIENVQRLRESLMAQGYQQVDIRPVRPGVEDCFIRLMAGNVT